MQWDPDLRKKFELFISKIPIFHRRITEEAVSKISAELASARGASQVEERDVIAAFFSGVPSPFYSMMCRLLEQTGFDYKKYGFPKNTKE